jgi:hypothetical protein
MNPEFRRQLWLHMSVERLVATPVVIGLLFVLVGVSNDWKPITMIPWALTLASLISGVVGGAAAIESVASEARARTWDWQRLSGLGPWKMTWGKLLGSTLHAHYAASFAYAVYIVTAMAHTPSGGVNPFSIVLLGVALGALLQSTGMAIAAWQITSQRPQASLAVSYVFSAGGAGMMLIYLISASERVVSSQHYSQAKDSHALHWYTWAPAPLLFSVFSVLAFLAWSVFANYRLMRTELEGRSAPLEAIVFPVFLACYVAGFATPPFGSAISGGMTVRLLTGQISIAAFAYVMCLAATMRRVDLERWWQLSRTNTRQAWRTIPAWILCAALSFVTAVAIALWIGTSSEDSGPAAAISIVLALIVLRDACLLVALRLRGGALASDGWILVFGACLHGFLPWIADGFGAQELRQFLSLDPTQGWHAVPVLMCELLLAMQWVRKSWTRERAPVFQTQKA